MVAQQRGSIINTASFVAVMGSATSQISYTASKGGVLAMSRELGVQFARQGIRVNSLCPGPVETPLLLRIFGDDPAALERRRIHWEGSPGWRNCAAVAFLASDDSSFITGRRSGRRWHQLDLRDTAVEARCQYRRAGAATRIRYRRGEHPGPGAKRPRGSRWTGRTDPPPELEALLPGPARNAFEDTVGRLLETIRLGVLGQGESLPPERELRTGSASAATPCGMTSSPWPRRATWPCRGRRYGGTFLAKEIPAPSG
jgi:hypothetical protein